MLMVPMLLAATFTACQSGDWSLPETWKEGRVPGPNDAAVVRDVALTVREPMSVGALTIGGEAKMTVFAVPMGEIASTPENLYTHATLVRVRDAFMVEGRSVVTAENDPKTGAAVKFEVGSFHLGANARLTASGTGWFWYKSANDPLATLTQGEYQTRALGAGGDDVPKYAYCRGAGYGAAGGGAKGAYGRAYGFAAAPFLPGSPNGLHNAFIGNAARAGGTVWIVCAGTMTLLGAIDADASPSAFGTGSGGGVWLAAKSLAVAPSASVSARGGKMTASMSYASKGSGGRVSLALGLSRRQLDALAAGKTPSGVTCQDFIGALPVDVRGGCHEKTQKYGESGTMTTVRAAGAEQVKALKVDSVPEKGRDDVRRVCLGHTVSNGCLVWKWGGMQYRMTVHNVANGRLRTRKGLRAGDLVGWSSDGKKAFVEAVPEEGFSFRGWLGNVPAGKERTNPLEIALAEPVELTPLYCPDDPRRATLVAAPLDGLRKLAKPIPVSGLPLAFGLELGTSAAGGTAVVEVKDGKGKAHVFRAPAKGDFPLVVTEDDLPLPLSLVRAEIEGAAADVKGVRAIYRTALGRAERHFAACESRGQPLSGGITVTDEKPVEVPIDLTRPSGIRFVLGSAEGAKMIVAWTSHNENRKITVGAQNEKLLEDFAGLPKGTPFTVEDSFVSLGNGLKQYVRPYLRPYRSRYEMVGMGYDYLADRDRLPGAAAHVNDVVFRRDTEGRLTLTWDGSLVHTFKPPRHKPDATVKSVTFVFPKGVAYALKPNDAADVDADSFELLDFAANPRAKAMKDAVYADGLQPGVRTFDGVPIRLARPLDSGDVAICHYGKATWAMQVDEYTGRSPSDGFGAAIHFRVPARDYVKAHVVFALDPDARKDKVLTLRLSRYILNGAGPNMCGDAKLDLTEGLPSGVREVGALKLAGRTLPLYCATVALDLKAVADLVPRDTHVDFELMGVTEGNRPDPKRESAFNVFGATLEAAPVTLDVVNLPGAPSNVFTQDEVHKALKLVLRGERASSACRVTLKATDFAGEKTLFTKAFDVSLARGAKDEREVDFTAAREPGLYRLLVSVSGDGGATDFSYETRLAVLPPSGRIADTFASPYGTWWFYGEHGSPGDWEIGGPIMKKAGIRKAYHHNWPTNALERWNATFSGYVYGLDYRGGFDAKTGRFVAKDGKDGETRFVEYVQKQLDKVPYADHIMVWHESGPKNGIPEEILGLPVPAATDDDRAAAAYVNEFGRIVRKHFPKLRIQVGNWANSLGAACRPFRGGANPDYYDAIGLETASQMMMPERLLVWGLQGMVIAKEAASYYAKRPVPVHGCYEYVYRTERILGEELQAAWYMRDTLISLANRMPLISPGLLFDAGNCYYASIWGCTGLFYRAPSALPKLSYVAYAALTKALDGVTLVKELDTGSSTVYALLFRRADGAYATAVWCARGEAELKVDGGGEARVMDMVGRETKLEGGRTTASECPAYVLTARPVDRVSVVARSFRQAENVAKAGREIFRFADASSVSNAPNARIRSKGHECLPMMRPSDHFAVKEVQDDEKGACLEVSLDTSKEKVNRYYTEYTTLWLKEPVEVKEPCEGLGIWVKGNSNWGQVRFHIVDRDGEEFATWGHPTYWDMTDWTGLLCVNFDGWAFANCRFRGWIKYDRRTGLTNSPWNREKRGGPNSNGKIDFPIRVLSVTVGLNREKLALTDFKPALPSIRLGAVKICTYSKFDY